jgi:hypothetical protein
MLQGDAMKIVNILRIKRIILESIWPIDWGYKDVTSLFPFMRYYETCQEGCKYGCSYTKKWGNSAIFVAILDERVSNFYSRYCTCREIYVILILLILNEIIIKTNNK